MREGYEKNMVLIKEEKEGENDRINTGGKMEDGQVVAQKKEKATSQISMVALAFSSNTASHSICIQDHFFKMLDQPWPQPSSPQLPGPCLKMDRWLLQGKNSETSDAGVEWERRCEMRNEVEVWTMETKKLERSKLNGREGKLCLLS